MAIVQALLALISRQMGRFLNTAFGWATTLLFGKVPQKRQIYLSAVSAASILWLVVVIGIVWPSAGTFLLAFVPLPDSVDDSLVRWIMFALAVTIPALVGVGSLFLVEPADRPKGVGGKIKGVLKGYPYTIGLALTLIMMILIAPILKIRDIFRRWKSTHVPIVVEPEDYSETAEEVQRVLRTHGIVTTPGRASWMLRWPTKIFTMFVGGAIDDLVADNLVVLRSPDVELMLHPSDLVISGREQEVMRAHAIVTEHLTFTKAYLTWSKEAHAIEDRLEALYHAFRRGAKSRPAAMSEVEQINKLMREQTLSYEEWEILFRERVLLEREILLKPVREEAEPDSPVIPAQSMSERGSRKATGVKLAAIAASVMTMAFAQKRARKASEEEFKRTVANRSRRRQSLSDQFK